MKLVAPCCALCTDQLMPDGNTRGGRARPLHHVRYHEGAPSFDNLSRQCQLGIDYDTHQVCIGI